MLVAIPTFRMYVLLSSLQIFQEVISVTFVSQSADKVKERLEDQEDAYIEEDSLTVVVLTPDNEMRVSESLAAKDFRAFRALVRTPIIQMLALLGLKNFCLETYISSLHRRWLNTTRCLVHPV